MDSSTSASVFCISAQRASARADSSFALLVPADVGEVMLLGLFPCGWREVALLGLGRKGETPGAVRAPAATERPALAMLPPEKDEAGGTLEARG